MGLEVLWRFPRKNVTTLLVTCPKSCREGGFLPREALFSTMSLPARSLMFLDGALAVSPTAHQMYDDVPIDPESGGSGRARKRRLRGGG